MYFGLQLYGAGGLWQQDPAAFPEKLREMGYSLAEPCVFLGGSLPVQIPGIWDEETFLREAKRFQAAGIRFPSMHVFAADWDKALPAMLRIAGDCGIRSFVLKCPEHADQENLSVFASQCVSMADALAAAGASLLLHNEKWDIAEKAGGKSVFEHVLEKCGGKVFAQVDVGWALAGGENPEALLWRIENLVKSIHYKDFRMDSEPQEVLIGNGSVDIPACFQFARAHGIPQIVDMDLGDPELLPRAAQALARLTQYRAHTGSILCILDTETGELKPLHRFDGVIEAPNWLANGDELLYNAEGRIWRYSISRDSVAVENVGSCVHCNNDHALSADNRYLAVSHDPEGGFFSHIYIMDRETGEVRQFTDLAPSFLHGWSPDGQYLTYCAFRPGSAWLGFDVDIYKKPFSGGSEIRLTRGEGYNDGSEYAPDGRAIWFNSTRSGLMQVWRMGPDGENPEQMTFSERNNWFPHVSPDGRKVVYLSFAKGELDPMEHLPNMQVQLRIMNADGTGDRTLLSFFGGQGSINVNSWAPDSRRAAVVIYELQHA